MSHELVRFEIPAEFVIRRLLPTGAELAYGFRHGFVSRADVVAVALEKYKAGLFLSGPEEELALLLSDDLDRVDDLVADLEIVDEPAEQRARIWLFLSLAWLLEHRESFEDLLEVIELLYTDFDYPDEIREMVRYMPPEPGEATGLDALEESWRQYVGRSAAEYRERDEAARG